MSQLFVHLNYFGLTNSLIFLGDELPLCEVEIADGEDIFVWNGVEVRKKLLKKHS
jgi:hypothetical protein